MEKENGKNTKIAEDYQEKLSAIHNLSREMTLCLDLDDICRAVLDAAEEILDFGNIDLFMVNQERNELCLKACRGLKEPEMETVVPLYGEKGITAYVARSRESLYVPDVRKDRRYIFGLKNSRSELCVPLKVKDRVSGVLDVESQELNAFSTEDRILLETLASHAAVAIENARLFKEQKEVQEKYRTILESIEDGYFEVDIAGNFTFFNDSLCRILGFSREELMGMNNREYMDEKTAKMVFNTFNRVFRTKTPAKAFDWEITRKNKEKLIVEASISLMVDPQGEPTGFRGIVRDITDRKRAEEEIRTLNHELERRIEERSKRNEIFFNTKQKLQIERNWEKGLNIIVESMMLLGFDRVGVFLVDSLQKNLVFHLGKGTGLPKIGTSVSLRKKEYFGVKCVLEKKTIHIEDSTSAGGAQIGSESKSLAWVPIMIQDEVFAALAVGDEGDGRNITVEDARDLEILAGMCGNFIDRTRLLVEPVAEKRLKTQFRHLLDTSESYIILEKKPKKSLEMFLDLITHGIPGFIVSRENPEKVKRKHKLVRTPFLWLSRSDIKNTLNPDDLPKLSYIIRDFVAKCEESAIFLDGLEYLIIQAGFDVVIRYLLELKDLIVLSNSRLIIPLYRPAISEKEFRILEREFLVLDSSGDVSSQSNFSRTK
jgi:PAS domain S-box-containing protein